MASCVDFVALLKGCAKHKDLQTGKSIHADAIKRGLLRQNIFIGSTLVGMYAKCGELPKAQQVFDELSVHDVVSWHVLMSGYAEHGHGEQALICFEHVKLQGFFLDAMAYTSILKACACIGAAEKGIEIHCEIIKQGWFYRDSVLGTALVDMYAKCGALAKAQHTFDQLSMRDVVSWNALIAGYAHHGHTDLAFHCIKQMRHDGLLPNAVTFACILKTCSSIGAMEMGIEIHNEIRRMGLLKTDCVLGTALVDMYAKCGALNLAQGVFDELLVRDAVSWSALCTGYCQHGQGEQALDCFKQMKCEGIAPGESTFACALKACASLGAADKGNEMHAQIIREGFEKSILIGNGLVDMYVKCGALAKAQQAMDEIPTHDAVSWNALIGGYAQHGHSEKALICFEHMQVGGLTPDAITFLSVLKACSSIGTTEKGNIVHAEIARLGFLRVESALGTALVDMYVKYGALEVAREVFQELAVHDVVSWTALMAGYAQQCHGEEALSCFERMQSESLSPNAVTFSCILKACGSIGAIKKGIELHTRVKEQGFLGENAVVGNALVDMYAKCGALTKAQEVFDELSSHDVVSWSALLAGYTQLGKHEAVLSLFQRMIYENVAPSGFTLTAVLKACRYLELVDEAKMYFETITTDYGVIPTVEHQTCMVDILGHAGKFEGAMGVIEQVPFSDRLTVWIALLNTCQKWKNMKSGKLAFDSAILLDENAVAAYVYMSNIYAASGMQEDAEKTFTKAQQVFDNLIDKDLMSWNVLIAGFCEHGRGEEALEIFEHMMSCEGLCPDTNTFLYVLKSCGRIGLVEKGKEVHFEIARVGLLGASSVLGNALVDMYAKCGDLAMAQLVFDELPTRDLVCWTALIAGYCQHGHGEEALNCFDRMIGEGLSPDSVTFTCILKVCSSTGAVEKGIMYFNAMSARYGITPSLEHQTCIVDLLVCAGHFERAMAVIRKMPPDRLHAWSTVLSACWKGGNVKLGMLAFDHAMQSDAKSAAAYVCTSNSYAAAGM